MTNAKTKKLVLKAHGFGGVCEDLFCVVPDAEELLAELKRVNAVVKENNLTEARVSAAVEWLPEHIAKDMSLLCDELVVLTKFHHFMVLQDETDGYLETDTFTIEQLQATLETAHQGVDEYIFINDEGGLKRREFQEALEEDDSSEWGNDEEGEA